jgi:hypothetical protein
MPALPLKSEYGPTLGELLAPRWRRASRRGRVLVVGAGVIVVAILAAAVARFEPPTLSYGGGVPFSFSYGDLYRAAAEPGAYVMVQRPREGEAEESFAVGPLVLPRYRGTVSAALALYASGYIDRLAARDRGFRLRGEGWTQVDSVSAYAVYNIFYVADVGGREMYGRNVLLVPERAGARRGVAIAMLAAAAEHGQVASPLLVGTKGVLEGPLTSFALG